MYDQWIGFAGKILTGNHRFSKKNYWALYDVIIKEMGGRPRFDTQT
jgi:hypothetical protein